MSAYSRHDHRAVGVALDALQSHELRFLAEFIAENLRGWHPDPTRIVDTLHKLIEEMPAEGGAA